MILPGPEQLRSTSPEAWEVEIRDDAGELVAIGRVRMTSARQRRRNGGEAGESGGGVTNVG